MRIAKHDVPVDVYEVTETPNSEGFMVKTLNKIIDAQGMDLQPLGGKVDIRAYGLESVTSGALRAFYDYPILMIGMVVSNGGKTYMVKGIKDWYSHSEAIFEPFEVVIP